MMEKCLSSLVVVCLLLAGTTNCQSSNSGRHCNRPVPGLDKMTHGIDITTFDLMSTGQEGLKYPVIEFTCNQDRVVSVNGEDYDLPDQIMSVTDLPGGIANAQNTLVKSYSEARRVIAADFGVSGNFGKFGFSSSMSLQRMQNSIANQSRFVSVVSAYESARKAFMVAYFRLHAGRDLQHFFDNQLAADFDPSGDPTSAATYRELIGYFGTHYFDSANFGGLLVVEEHTQNEYLLTHSELEVSAQAQASFASVLSVSVGGRYAASNVDSQYTQMSSRTIRYFGGTANLLAEGGHQAWQPTVKLAPWLFKGRLVSITRLIRDNGNNGKKRALDRAIEDYMLRASLEEMLRLLSTRSTSWSLALQEQVNTLKTRPLLTVDIVQPLTEAILLRFGPAFGGWTQYQNKYYALFTEGLTWAGAKERCEEMNSHLVTIGDEAENTFVYNLVRGKSPCVWLGLSNRGSEAWTWVYGQPLGNYRPWGPLQPDNSGTCASLMANERPYSTVAWLGAVKRWDDLPCTGVTLSAVCESAISTGADRCGGDWQVFRGNCYKLLTQALAWDDAKTFCLSLGAQLVSIHSANENTFVTNMIAASSASRYWLGVSDRRQEGVWVWTDGQHTSYTSWTSGEPNNSGGMGEENCAWINSEGTWNDISCHSSYKYRGICKK